MHVLRRARAAAALAAMVLVCGLHPACGESPAGPAATSGGGTTARLRPEDLVYRGAFRLPGPSGSSDWAWSGNALAYYPDGDPKGPDDGCPGSLFATGHDHHVSISEISIPAPVVSKSKDVADLLTAATLQPFADVRAGHFTDYEIYRAGLAYLPKQGRQTSGKLYFCLGQHMHEGYKGPTHFWCDLNLSNPRTAGPWCVGDLDGYITNDYIFPIPASWADAYAPGMRLVTGRFRDGGQGGMGPSIIAIGPWNDGDPPPAGTHLKAVTLLRYSCVTDDEAHTLKDYHHADEWEGGAWLTAGDKVAVVFVGTKGLGKCWYGFANGVVWPEEGPFPPIPPPPNDDRGWWSTRFEGQMIFYDPADLAAVARGKMKPHEPQPYATLRIDDVLFNVKHPQQKTHVRSCAFDPERGLLYVFEFRADEDDRSLVHVWHVKP